MFPRQRELCFSSVVELHLRVDGLPPVVSDTARNRQISLRGGRDEP